MKNNIDWIIHLVLDGSDFEFIGNAHTHGLERYGHEDFQVVLRLPQEEISRLLNTLGLRVQAGERFTDSDMIKGLYLDCDIRLDAVIETGRTVLRLIIPDKNNHFPEDPLCDAPYKYQTQIMFED